MSIPGDLIETLRKLSSLEQRTEDVRRSQDRLEQKLDSLIDRLARIEANYENLRQNVKNEILAELRSDLTRVQTIFDLQQRGLLKTFDSNIEKSS
ncbi:MAG: hypothetical protein HC898_01460 [Phycisphaerales bacterium]|nr:hypothetical protein [Phycisphaerales bacterium]